MLAGPSAVVARTAAAVICLFAALGTEAHGSVSRCRLARAAIPCCPLRYRPLWALLEVIVLRVYGLTGVLALTAVTALAGSAPTAAIAAEDAAPKSGPAAMQEKQRELLRQYAVEPVSPDTGPVTLDDMILDWTDDGYVLAARFASGLAACPAEEPASMSLIPLKGLIKLRAIELNAVAVSELAPLLQWKGLRDVKIIGCGKIKNLSVLGQLTQLDKLKLQNQKGDLGGILKKLTALTELELPQQELMDMEFVRGMAKLIKLDVSDNPKLANIAPLVKLRYLHELDLSGTAVTDFKPLLGLPKLTKLTVSRGADVSILEGRKAAGLSITER